MSVTQVIPQTIQYELLLTALSPISHHDAAKKDDSNRNLFNRQKMILPSSPELGHLSQEDINSICLVHPVPTELLPIIETLDFPTFVGAALVRLFMESFGAGDGEGLFKGVERYSMLEPRIKQAANSAGSLRGWWDKLCEIMCVGIPQSGNFSRVLRLVGLPKGVSSMVLRAFSEGSRTIVMVAKQWATEAKQQSGAYAQAAGITQSSDTMSVPHFTAASASAEAPKAQIVEAPCVSSNSVRHQLVRDPAWRHMARTLGIQAGFPGKGTIPEGVEAIFVNGGNIKAGAKQEGKAFVFAHQIREFFPGLDLLGGVANSFDLGASALRVNSWIVCKENLESIGPRAAELPVASLSIFDMVDDVTHTRQATRHGLGQMIMSAETLAQGAQVLVRFTVDPFARQSTHGALVAAMREYEGYSPTVGGQKARGYGAMGVKLLSQPDGIDMDAVFQAYDAYLRDNSVSLLAELVSGRMGTGKDVVS